MTRLPVSNRAPYLSVILPWWLAGYCPRMPTKGSGVTARYGHFTVNVATYVVADGVGVEPTRA